MKLYCIAGLFCRATFSQNQNQLQCKKFCVLNCDGKQVSTHDSFLYSPSESCRSASIKPASACISIGKQELVSNAHNGDFQEGYTLVGVMDCIW